MAFTTRRGRPRKAADTTDLGTPELRFKHAHRLTAEPIDLCLERSIISNEQHWCGLHLRWLYTLRYGAPNLTTNYNPERHSAPRDADDPAWRRLREAEYREAMVLLRPGRYDDPVMRLCIFNELPAFLNPTLRENAWTQPAYAERLYTAQQRLSDGLTVLVTHWKH